MGGEPLFLQVEQGRVVGRGEERKVLDDQDISSLGDGTYLRDADQSSYNNSSRLSRARHRTRSFDRQQKRQGEKQLQQQQLQALHHRPPVRRVRSLVTGETSGSVDVKVSTMDDEKEKPMNGGEAEKEGGPVFIHPVVESHSISNNYNGSTTGRLLPRSRSTPASPSSASTDTSIYLSTVVGNNTYRGEKDEDAFQVVDVASPSIPPTLAVHEKARQRHNKNHKGTSGNGSDGLCVLPSWIRSAPQWIRIGMAVSVFLLVLVVILALVVIVKAGENAADDANMSQSSTMQEGSSSSTTRSGDFDFYFSPTPSPKTVTTEDETTWTSVPRAKPTPEVDEAQDGKYPDFGDTTDKVAAEERPTTSSQETTVTAGEQDPTSKGPWKSLEKETEQIPDVSNTPSTAPSVIPSSFPSLEPTKWSQREKQQGRMGMNKRAARGRREMQEHRGPTGNKQKNIRRG